MAVNRAYISIKTPERGGERYHQFVQRRAGVLIYNISLLGVKFCQYYCVTRMSNFPLALKLIRPGVHVRLADR